MRTVTATRYVTPFREGGSMPALVEADDDGMYVVKLRGAGQGDAALSAELLVGELARAAGLPVPEIVFVDLDPAFGKSEPDPEIRELLEKSSGMNLGLDYLPGAAGFDPVARPGPDPGLASRVVLFDAFALNVDRTPRNPNILSWHREPWLIDHGAAMYFQHGWRPVDPLQSADDPFREIKDHVLLPWATQLAAAEAFLSGALSVEVIERVTSLLPEAWLGGAGWAATEHRTAFARWLTARRVALPALRQEAERARTMHV